MAARRTRKKTVPVAIDLRAVNPHGRVDVLAAMFIEQFASARVPELLPLIEQQREVIHASLNEQLGPHAIDLSNVLTHLEPFMPVLGAIYEHVKEKVQRANEAGNSPQAGRAA